MFPDDVGKFTGGTVFTFRNVLVCFLWVELGRRLSLAGGIQVYNPGVMLSLSALKMEPKAVL